MALMRESMSKEDFDRAEQGLPPIKRTVAPRPEPEPPDVKERILFKDIPLDMFSRLLNARFRSMRNKDGMRFTGFDVEIELSIKEGKEEHTETLRGWMPETEWLLFLRNARSKIDYKVVQFI
jgi:hypothetical protein